MQKMLNALDVTLFGKSTLYTYAIIDAAKIEDLTTELLIYEPTHKILFNGDDASKLEDVAPYLVRLERGSIFTQWVLREVYGNDGAIFLQSSYDIETLSQHFKQFIKVTREITDPESKKQMIQEGYLAYYDPRVLPEWLESVEPVVMQKFLSMTSMLYYEDINYKHRLHRYRLQDKVLKHSTHNLKETLA